VFITETQPERLKSHLRHADKTLRLFHVSAGVVDATR
jgi:hypothetical protein